MRSNEDSMSSASVRRVTTVTTDHQRHGQSLAVTQGEIQVAMTIQLRAQSPSKRDFRRCQRSSTCDDDGESRRLFQFWFEPKSCNTKRCSWTTPAAHRHGRSRFDHQTRSARINEYFQKPWRLGAVGRMKSSGSSSSAKARRTQPVTGSCRTSFGVGICTKRRN